ncbi:MAG: FkbM family methyltransferase [Zoogloeaceae bacterium]|jgi:FkbM family methyltransferase|nr:FkbM family methyltransferase [Zoogloeaceae bacterium]
MNIPISYAQNFEDVMLCRALGAVGQGFYIDVGANDPVIDSVTKAFYDQGWRGINIEPLPSCHDMLARERPEDINLQCAAGAAAGELELWEPDIPGWASLSPEVIAQHQREGYRGVLHKVQVMTLTEICRQHVRGEIHFLKIDVEGCEADVIAGMDITRFRPWIIVVESTQPGTSVENHQQWERQILSRAYEFVYADGLNRFYIAGEHGALREKFRYPPNVFDNFIRHTQNETLFYAEKFKAWAQPLEARAQKAEALAQEAVTHAQEAEALAQEAEAQTREARARARKAEARAREAAEHARQRQAQLELLHRSTSWRVTRPLRVLKRLASGDFSPLRLIVSRTRQRARDDVNAALQYILRRPALCRALTHAIKSSPWLHRRLLHFIGSLDAPAAGPDLSPWAFRIYRALSTAAVATDTENTADDAEDTASTANTPSARPRLAYVSPLPPDPSGISSYSAELLPALGQWYEIEVIVTHPEMDDAWIREHCPIRTVEWFRAHAACFDRVLYHFGNSPFHQHMFALLDEIPGIVVLHDFFLSGVQAHRALFGATHVWEQALHASHGYRALAEQTPINEKVIDYPANLPVLQAAQGVIVHSDYARQLASYWYGNAAGRDWTILPHLRVPARQEARAKARETLGIAADAFLVCAFGIMGPTKLNDRLIEAWLASPLAADSRALLVFVGENSHDDHGHKITRMIRHGAGRIRITGWAKAAVFQQYLAAADVGVQLRAMSRGETSGTVLDCMNHGLATIVNAHGSLADLDTEGLWMLPDEFSDQELIDALITLWHDAGQRARLGEAARTIIATRHAPEICARQYAEAIERYAAAPGWTASLPMARKGADPYALAVTLARDFPPAPRHRQLLVDVSALARVDLRTGIQRVVRAVLEKWLDYDESWQVEPVYAVPEGYRYARRFTCDFLGIDKDWAEDALVDAWAGDVFFGLDFHNSAVPDRRAILEKWRDAGVGIGFLVYDLLPVTHPDFFPEGAAQIHQRWLETIAVFDFAIGISHSTAKALEDWLATSGTQRTRPLRIEYAHIGADLVASAPTRGLPSNAAAQLRAIKAKPSFLMVGTVEPRKGHADVLDAFDVLWKQRLDINLVIVGKEGWMVDALAKRLRTYAAHEPRLIWLENVSDEYLECLYGASIALIAASHAEGFGLPLIEAARHKLPIIARNIPVFHEVAGEYAYYFDHLAPAIEAWLEMYRQGRHPLSDNMPWLLWEESAQQLWSRVTQA